MKKHLGLILGALVLLVIFMLAIRQKTNPNVAYPQTQSMLLEPAQNNQTPAPTATQQQSNTNTQPGGNSSEAAFGPPLDRAEQRVSKKYFGIFVTPQNSPVQPERFSGYHTGADFETFPEEANIDVPVHAVCTGKLLTKRYASGYGGVAVESCTLNNQSITVVYGHLKLSSILPSVGTELHVGDELGILGKGYSSETDGERKHLHLGFHKGTSINILGYVQNKSQLANWIDPCLYVCGKP